MEQRIQRLHGLLKRFHLPVVFSLVSVVQTFSLPQNASICQLRTQSHLTLNPISLQACSGALSSSGLSKSSTGWNIILEILQMFSPFGVSPLYLQMFSPFGVHPLYLQIFSIFGVSPKEHHLEILLGGASFWRHSKRSLQIFHPTDCVLSKCPLGAWAR